MSAALLLAISILIFIIGYIWYGRYLVKKFSVDGSKPTPAHTKTDGIDFVPAKSPVLLGHHFASIAGAGPILGPIYAAIFGWVPVLLWVVLGSIFVGGTHDFSSLIASIRHGGKSIGEVIEDHIGRAGKKLFLVFAWSVLILVIAVFIKAVASVFVKEPSTSTASILFIFLAVFFGLSIYRLKVSLFISSIIGVLLVFLAIYLGTIVPLKLAYDFWVFFLLMYIIIASVTPVWILLQPRDYLNSFLLYFILLAGMVGIFMANPTIQMPAFTQFETNLGTLFPLLFVTVACGAISGFHSLVSSGTTAKQLNRETDAKPVAYGAMLIEGVLAVVALITAVTLLQSDYLRAIEGAGGGPIGIFSRGIGKFVSTIGITENIGVTFAALAISAFALTSLDTATRLARFAFQEFFETENHPTLLSRNRYLATLITVLFAAILVFTGSGDTLWPLFGSANQLLASIALLAITVWLAELGKDNRLVRYPMYFMFSVTLTALAILIYKNITAKNISLTLLSLLLFMVAILLVIHASRSIKNLKNKVQPIEVESS